MPLTPEERADLERAICNLGNIESQIEMTMRSMHDVLDELEKMIRELANVA